MSNKWFETVAIAEQCARKRIPKSVYGALVAGTEAGVSMRDNTAAFDELGFRPVTAGQAADPEITVNVMGPALGDAGDDLPHRRASRSSTRRSGGRSSRSEPGDSNGTQFLRGQTS